MPPMDGGFRVFMIDFINYPIFLILMGEEDFLVNIHKSYRNVVAICDKNLFGKKIVEGERQLDLTGEFFNGGVRNEGALREIILDQSREDATFNIVGNKSVFVAKDLGIIVDEGISKIGGVSFALVLG